MYKTASPRVHDPRSQTHMPHQRDPLHLEQLDLCRVIFSEWKSQEQEAKIIAKIIAIWLLDARAWVFVTWRSFAATSTHNLLSELAHFRITAKCLVAKLFYSYLQFSKLQMHSPHPGHLSEARNSPWWWLKKRLFNWSYWGTESQVGTKKINLLDGECILTWTVLDR